MNYRIGIWIGVLPTLCFGVNAHAQRVTKMFPNNITMRGISLEDYRHAMCVGDSATIFITSTAGFMPVWDTLSAPCDRSHTFYGVSYYDSSHAVIIADAGLIFITSDTGKHWLQTGKGMTSHTLRGIIHAGDNLIIVGDSGIMLRSANNGVTWSKIKTNTIRNITGISINAFGHGYFVGAHGLIGKTTDVGSTWLTVTDTITNNYANDTPINFRAIAIDNNNDTALAVGDNALVAIDGGIFRQLRATPSSSMLDSLTAASVANRASYSSVLWCPNYTLSWLVFGDNDFFITQAPDSIPILQQGYESGDADGSSDEAFLRMDCAAVWWGYGLITIQFAGQHEVINTSNDTMNTWFAGSIPLDTGDDATSGTINLSGLGVGIGNVLFASIQSDGYGFTTAVGGTGCLISRTTDSGQTWAGWRARGFGGFDLTDIYTIDSNTAIAAGWAGYCYRTTDGGVDWIRTLADPNQERLHSIANPADSIFVVSGDFGTIIRSTDNAMTWMPASPPTTAYLEAVAFSSAEIGISVGSSGTIIRTTDQGLTWANVNNQLTGTDFSYRQLVAFPNGTYYATTDSAGLWRSNDEGQNWIQIQSIPHTIGMGFYNENIGVVAEQTWSSALVPDTMKFAFSRDSFAAKTEFTIPIVNNRRMVFHFLDSTSFLCLGSDGFVVKVDMSQGSAIVTDLSTPQSSSLQAFPNPSATHATTIEYDLDISGATTIELWSMLGEKVETLFAGNEGSGHHSQQLKINPALHGSFFVKVISGAETKTVPVVVE